MLRGAGVLPLADPDFSADPSEFPILLRKYIASDDDTLMLLTAWLLGCLRPEGPYPVLTISGEQGSGKSTVLRLMRRIIDPHALDMRTPPEDQRDLLSHGSQLFHLGFRQRVLHF